MSATFLTGFPGFLGVRMVERLLGRTDPDDTIHCLVQDRFRGQAETRARALHAGHPDGARIQLHTGDITLPDLGLGPVLNELQSAIEEVYHFAAVYDLGVSRSLGLKVNVDGTRHMLDFAAGCPHLARFHYVSTCYVSGRYPGTFTEDMLREGQAFNNYYEETKYWAEVEAQRRMQEGVPVTIYRPAVVVGDSTTGETQKYDGPYYIMRWMMRWKRIAPVPMVGNPDDHRLNVVPRDFVVDAMDALSQHPDGVGMVYQLSDPNPPTVRQMIASMGRAMGRNVLAIPVSARLLKKALQSIGPLRRWVQIPPEGIDYFNHPATYPSDHTQAHLEGTGIHCPAFSTYVQTLVDFVKAHPDVATKGMV